MRNSKANLFLPKIVNLVDLPTSLTLKLLKLSFLSKKKALKTWNLTLQTSPKPASFRKKKDPISRLRVPSKRNKFLCQVLKKTTKVGLSTKQVVCNTKITCFKTIIVLLVKRTGLFSKRTELSTKRTAQSNKKIALSSRSSAFCITILTLNWEEIVAIPIKIFSLPKKTSIGTKVRYLTFWTVRNSLQTMWGWRKKVFLKGISQARTYKIIYLHFFSLPPRTTFRTKNSRNQQKLTNLARKNPRRTNLSPHKST